MQQALNPYIVTLWNGREPEDAPEDVQQLLRQRGRHQQSNILVFVLDSQGNYVHSFDGMTDRHPGNIGDIKKRMPSYFLEQLADAGKQLGIPDQQRQRTATAHLPTTAEPGIRLFVSLGENRLQHFAVPVVEAVAFQDTEKQTLRYQTGKQSIDAKVIQRWLAPMYPPAVMDGHGNLDKVAGTLEYQTAGESATHRYAILRGTVQLYLDNTTRISYQGPLDLVLRYSKTSDALEAVWGTYSTRVPRHNQQGKAVETVTMTVAIEPSK